MESRKPWMKCLQQWTANSHEVAAVVGSVIYEAFPLLLG
jgi:hypothetical protein